MIAMNGKDRDCDVDIRVFIVYVIESTALFVSILKSPDAADGERPLEVLGSITQHLQLAWLLSIAIHT